MSKDEESPREKLGLLIFCALIAGLAIILTLFNLHYNRQINHNESADIDQSSPVIIATQMRQFRAAARICEDGNERLKIKRRAIDYLVDNKDNVGLFHSYILAAIPNDLIDWATLEKQQPQLASYARNQLRKKCLEDLAASQKLVNSDDTEQQRQNRCQIIRRFILDLISRGIVSYQDLNLTAQELVSLS